MAEFGAHLWVLLFQLPSQSQLLTIGAQHKPWGATEGVVGCSDIIRLCTICIRGWPPAPLPKMVALLIET